MSDLKVKKNVYKVKFFKVEYEEATEIHDLAQIEFFNRVKKIQYDLNVYDKDFDDEYQENKSNNPDVGASKSTSEPSKTLPEDNSLDEEDILDKKPPHCGQRRYIEKLPLKLTQTS